MSGQEGGPAVADDAAGHVADQVRTELTGVVGDVLTTRRAHAAYAVFARIEDAAGRGYDHDDVYRSFVGTALVLAAAGARAAGGDGTGVVRWVRDNLGAWPSAAAARAGAAVSGGELADVQDDLREHLLPAVLWFLAGTVAVAGAGDREWLRRATEIAEPEQVG